MIYAVNLIDLAEKINPLAFAKYLKDTGWNLFQTKKTYVKIFQFEQNNEFFQITIPMEKKLRDYKEAMYQAIETLAKAEKKSVEQVMLYLLNFNTDNLKSYLEISKYNEGSEFLTKTLNRDVQVLLKILTYMEKIKSVLVQRCLNISD